MKKEDFTGIIVYMLILAVAIVFGVTVLQKHASECGLGVGLYLFYIIGSIIAGVVFNAILFEIAHIVGARVGGYEVVFVSILGVTWYKENGKFHSKFGSYDGLTGETKIVPIPNKEKEPNPTPYLWFGTLFFLAELALVIVSFALLTGKGSTTSSTNVAYFFLVMGVLGGMILLYNILPFKLDATTDGYRLTLVSNPANKKAFNELLRVEYAIANGEKDVEVATFTEITNFTADLNLNKVYILLDKRQFAEAEVLLDGIIAAKEKVSEKVYVRARSQKIYINIMSKSLEEARAFYDEQVPMSDRRDISNDISMVSIRTYLLMSGLLDKSRSECMIALKNVQTAFRKTLKARQKVEVDLFNEAIERIDEAHPDWGLKDYKLTIVDEKKN